MNAQQAIEIADRDGFCHIGQHTYLWKTCEAAAHVKLGEIETPFVLIESHNWADAHPVKNAGDKRLIKSLKERK